MSDTAAPPLFTDPSGLPEDAQHLWAAMVDLSSQRDFNAERPMPGGQMPPLHQQIWTASDQLLATVPGFLNNRLLRANLHLHQQQLPEAEAEARFVVQHAPCSNPGHAVLKRVLALRGALDEGEQIYAVAASHCPDLAPYLDAALFLTGELRYVFPEESLAIWTAHLAAMPGDAEVALAAAELLLAFDRIEDAQALLEVSAAAQPDALEVRLLLGSIHADQGDLAKARIDFQAVLDADEYHGKARLQLARVYAEVEELKASLKLLQEGMAENTGDADYNMLLGQVALAMDQHEIAGTAFVRMLAADPDEEEDIAEAEDALRSLGLWHDGNVRLQFLLAERALNNDEGLKAIKHLSNIQQAGVDTRELFLKMAEAHYAMGLLDDPLNFLVLAKSKKRRTYDTHGVEDPSDRRLDLLMLSLLLQAEYPRAEALQKLESHRDIERNSAEEPEEYLMVLADCCARVNEMSRAREALRLAIQRHPLAVLPWLELATLLERTEDPAGAVQAFRQVWELGGPDPEVARHLALGYEQLGAVPWAEYFAARAYELEAEEAEDAQEEEEPVEADD